MRQSVQHRLLQSLSLASMSTAFATPPANKPAKHPFDSVEAASLDYLPKSWSEPAGTLQDTVYEDYALQAISIENAAAHPTALVQSAAMASVPPPLPSYHPILPQHLITDGVLSAPQLESVIYAGNAHETHLKGWFRQGEIAGQLVGFSGMGRDAAKDDRLQASSSIIG